MATWKYGPIETTKDFYGYEEPIKNIYEVHYQTTADVLSIIKNGEYDYALDYEESRAIGKMITQWYINYVLSNNELAEKLSDLLSSEE